MTGFIRGLFNKKKADKTETTVSSSVESQDSNAFFLDADSAKTYGDIDYMRTAKSVKKSFPKMGNSTEGAEMIEAVSSMEKSELTGGESVTYSSKKEAEAPTASDRRTISSDTSMDMFRNMAKDIKKK
ncbi:hypothetical protein TUMEXPCC7403_21020 [Tumidithrix helvetica PCC 7403]|uniref:hypothetical protein n=1 Tax=Tumidithrix helvetica TaxID=3457545 RepID=UPI003CA0A5D2